MKRFFLIVLTLAGVFIILSAYWWLSKSNANPAKSENGFSAIGNRAMERLSLHANKARQFADRHGFNRDLCLLIDMSIESGKNRFFLYDLLKDSIRDEGLVTHGRCNETWLAGRKYANDVGSGCTSLGKYKVGARYTGRFGPAYKLTGLDTTNNNAFRRYVVLHAHACVPDKEVHPYPICQSDGCPTVSKTFLKTLAEMIDGSSQPILLWIYD